MSRGSIIITALILLLIGFMAFSFIYMNEVYKVETRELSEEGRNAALVGLPVDSCPYRVEDFKRKLWVRGWQGGFLELKKER